jgi:hypothetical protein
MFVALIIQHAMRMRRIAICGLPDLHTFSHYLLNCTILEKKQVIEHKMCVICVLKHLVHF